MRLLSRAIAGVLVFFGVVGLLFGLEISDIERGQTQAICGAVALVGGVLTFLLSEVIDRLEKLARTLRAGTIATAEYPRPASEPALGLAMGDTTPPPAPPAPPAMPAPLAVPQPTWMPPPQPQPAPTAATDHVDAAMAAVAAAIGEPEDEPAPQEPVPAPAPVAAEAPRPGLAAILAANRGPDAARRPTLFERVRAERAAASAQEPPAEPVAAPINPFAPRDPFRGIEPFGSPSPAPEAAEAPPPAPVLNLRPTLVPSDSAPVERARPSLRALAASRSREEAIAAEAPAPMSPPEPPAPEAPAEPAPERPPFPRDVFQRAATARKDEPSAADMRLRERLAALRGENPPPEPPPVPAAPATPVSNPSEEVVGRYESNGSTYVMYADGTIEAETETGVFRFGSLDELKAFIEAGGK